MVRPGRPTLYRPEHCALVRQHCHRGASNDALARLLGVAPRSIDNWIARIPAFAAAVREGRAVAEAEELQALYQRAVGDKRTVERIVRCPGGYTTVTYTRHYLPDTCACKRWLCKRRPQNWRRNPHAPLPGPVPAPSAVPSSALPAAHQFTVMDDARVANALYERAVGYEQPVERVMTRGVEWCVVKYIRRYPPQTAACIFWLANRRPQNWGFGAQAATGVSPAKSTVPQARSIAPQAHKLKVDPEVAVVMTATHQKAATSRGSAETARTAPTSKTSMGSAFCSGPRWPAQAARTCGNPHRWERATPVALMSGSFGPRALNAE